MAQKEYQRLTRTRSRSEFGIVFVSRSSLWLGKDHLLCVATNGYTETYKRFYFRDIQTISLQRTERHLWWGAILGFFAFIFFVFTIAGVPKSPPAQWTSGQMAGGIFLGSVTGFFILLLLINLFYGPACKCFLRTAVQIEELPSLNRLRRARKALARLRPLIAAAQGELTLEEISSRIQATAGTPPKTTPVVVPAAAPEPPTTTPGISGMGTS